MNHTGDGGSLPLGEQLANQPHSSVDSVSDGRGVGRAWPRFREWFSGIQISIETEPAAERDAQRPVAT